MARTNLSPFAVASLGMLLATVGCEAPRASAEGSLGDAAAQIADVLAEHARAAGPGKGGGGGKKKGRFSDSPIYVDGAFRGMLKYAELPPTLRTRFKTFEDDDKVVRRFAWTELFAAMDVDVSAIAAVHFYGGRDIICVVDGEELRRVGDTFRFSFTRATAGFPRLELPDEGIRYNTFVDKLRAVAVYLHKTPPSYDDVNGLRMPDGTAVDKGFPYAAREHHGGTRVYLDGSLVSVFQRRALDSEGQAEGEYELNAALRGFGIDLSKVRRAQLVAEREQIVADLQGEALAAGVSFDVPRGSHGRIQVRALSEEGLEAVLLYASTDPADRSLPMYQGGSPNARSSGDEVNDFEPSIAARHVQ